MRGLAGGRFMRRRERRIPVYIWETRMSLPKPSLPRRWITKVHPREYFVEFVFKGE